MSTTTQTPPTADRIPEDAIAERIDDAIAVLAETATALAHPDASVKYPDETLRRLTLAIEHATRGRHSLYDIPF